MLKRHEIEILLKAGHPKTEVARLTGVSARSVHRIAEENPIVEIHDAAERAQRHIGRPSIVEDFRKLVLDILNERADLPSREILRRVRLAGYHGGKTALYELVASLRPKPVRPLVRFEGLPGEFSQHDFGQYNVKFVDGTFRRVHFFASRLKYSRYIRVSLVQDETVESLVRTLAEHLHGWGGRPLLCVFDRPKTIALKWNRRGEVTEWNPVFAYATLEMALTGPPDRVCGESSDICEVVVFLSAVLPRRGGSPTTTRRVASGSESGASQPSHGSDCRCAFGRGGASTSSLAGAARGSGLAHPGLRRTHGDGDV